MTERKVQQQDRPLTACALTSPHYFAQEVGGLYSTLYVRSTADDRMAQGRNLGGERHRCVASSLIHGRPGGWLTRINESFEFRPSSSYIIIDSTTTVYSSSSALLCRRHGHMQQQRRPFPFPPSGHLRARRIHTHTRARVRIRHAAKGFYLQRAPRPRPHAHSSFLRCCH